MKSDTVRAALAALALMALVACDNAEERAQAHYERGLALIEDGEPEKAILEFRNAIRLNQDALEPRLAFARLQMDLGNPDAAAGQYLRVVEFDPDNLEARLALGRMMLAFEDVEQADLHVSAALRLAPEDPQVRGLQARLAYLTGDADTARTLADAVLAEVPGDPTATMVLVDGLLDGDDPAPAIPLVDAALEVAPEDFDLHFAKLRAAEATGDVAGVGAQLATMVATFPDDQRLVRGLVRWQVGQGDIAGAEKTLRDLAASYPDNPKLALDVAGFLNARQGPDAALAELERLAASGAHPAIFARALAEFTYLTGDRDAAIAQLRALRDTDIDSDARIGVDTQLAEYLAAQGATDEARTLVTAVLEEDPENAEALQLRARDALNQDRAEDAIRDLRAALDVKPRDPGVLTLLAEAHLRNGSPGLAQERLALAVQSSDVGIEESLRYVNFLKSRDELAIAKAVLDDALARHGLVPALLAEAAQLRLGEEDWAGAEAIAAQLTAMAGNPNAVRMGEDIRVAVLSGQQKFDQSIGLLRSLWAGDSARPGAMENLVRSYLQTGQVGEAITFLQDVLADDQTNLDANLLLGSIHAYSGDLTEAEAVYRRVIADHPKVDNGYRALSSLLLGQGRAEEADTVITTGLANVDNAAQLEFTRAGRLEALGDFDGAIEIYSRLYDANRVSDVLANNLASLLSDHRDDPESLERAYTIAKRLRAATSPAFQDTYGWILFKRGEYERALAPLKAAAEGLAANPIVQYHLGMVYDKLGQDDLAREQLQKAVDLGRGSGLPQVDAAAGALQRLSGG